MSITVIVYISFVSFVDIAWIFVYVYLNLLVELIAVIKIEIIFLYRLG